MDEQPLLNGRYRLLHRLGEGGMGVVFAGRDEQLDRAVAIKMLRPASADPKAGDRLRREARAAARVDHPNICRVYDVGETVDGRTFVAMELLEGESLAARVARGPLPVAEAGPIGLSVLTALEALHASGLVHRDLKPSNIFLTRHGVKLLDFGLTRAAGGPVEASDALTTAGTVVGSPAYMAPEQVLNRPVDGRADLYALGVVLFEMLTGQRPFRGASPLEIVHAVVYHRPPALGGSLGAGAIDRVIRRALSKDPAERYASAGEMAEALRGALAQVDSGEAPRIQRLTRLMVVPFRLLRPDPDIDFLSFGLADAIATSLAGAESLVVRSSLAGARYAGAAIDPKAIAAEADVDAVLTGTLLRAGEQLRLAAHLLAVPEGTILWTHTAQATLGDIFELQDDLASRIVRSLSTAPLGGRERRADRATPASAKAYELYLRANTNCIDTRNFAVARDLYVECLCEDPQYAPAWARLGRCYRLSAKFGSASADEVRRNLDLARAAFDRALGLDPDLPEAHNLLTALETDLGQAADAVVRLLGQLRKRPSDPDLFAGLVHACRYCGLLGASLAAAERARQIDPHVITTVAHTYWMCGQYESALRDPPGGIGYIRGLALASLGRTEEAAALLREREQAATSPMVATYLFALRALLEGDFAAARRALDEVAPHNPDPEAIYYVARTYARLGTEERALAELARAVEGGFFCYPGFLNDPWWDSFRAGERFQGILREAERRHLDAAARFTAAGGARALGVSTSAVSGLSA